jgi:hypothetical protein
MVMVKQLSEPLEVAKRIDDGNGAAAEFSRFKTTAIEIVSALATWACRRRERLTEHLMPPGSHEDARLELVRFLYW